LTSSRRSSGRLTLAVAVLAVGGCAAAPRLPPVTAAAVELTDVPFFPQTQHQCGPAALATILADSGVAADPTALANEVYVAGLHGSLQAELLGATRRNGRIPYVLAPDAAALFAEVGAGRPVLVLQNLGLPRVPLWHYAVVVGFDAERGRVLLRSGREPRRSESSARFLRSWQRGMRWAFVAVAPGTLPATAAPAAYVRAAAGAEPLLPPADVEAAYAVALERWPDDELVLFAAANRRLVARDLAGAAALYRRLLAVAPANAAARNNFANTLAEQGCGTQALAEARSALAAVTRDDPLYDAIRDTVATLEAAPAGATGHGACD
jgi:hypothetical protein